MALSAKLELRQGQQLVMTPQLQQAIRLLQLSNLELTEFVDAELERNPLLEREETTSSAKPAEEAPTQRAEDPVGDSADDRWLDLREPVSDHTGALHLWIHLWEASNTPERAEAAADRLLPLAPAAGHLVHMPGHLFQRVGRYNDAVKANQLAVVADEDYITQCRAQGLYPMAYYPHNIHFLWFAATMAGESKLAIDAADKTTKSIPVAALKDVPLLQTFLLAHDYSLVRFGKWDEILALPAPRADTLFTRATRHYSRGMALIRKNDFAAATKEIEAVKQIAADPKLIAAPTSMSLNLADSVLRVGI